MGGKFRGLVLIGAVALSLNGCGKPPAQSPATNKPLFVPVEEARRDFSLERPEGESENPPPRFKLPEPTDPEPASQAARFHLEAPDDVGPANQAYATAQAPAGSLAQGLAASGGEAKLRWRPQWRYQGAGGVTLTTVALSADGSVLGVVEVATEPGQPDASALVLFDTYRWTILRVQLYPNRRLTHLAFIPGTMRAAAVAGCQPKFDQPQEILTLDLGLGQELKSTRQVRPPVVALTAVADYGLFVLAQTTPGHPGGMWRLSEETPDAPPLARQPELAGNCLAVSRDRALIAVAGPTGIALAKITDLQRRDTVPTPGVDAPQAVIFVNETERLALLGSGQPALLVGDGPVRQLTDRAGSVLTLNSDEQLLVFGLEREHALALQQLPAGEVVGSIKPGAGKFKTTGAPLAAFWFGHLRKYLVVDAHGNFCLYQFAGKRWRKEILLNAAK